jgi:hypothetical protein
MLLKKLIFIPAINFSTNLINSILTTGKLFDLILLMMLFISEPSRRHAELVSASLKTTLKHVQNRMMCVNLKEMPKRVRHDVQGCSVLRKTVL